MEIAECPSPNYGDRRGVVRPDMVVVHFTAMTGAAEALKRLCDPTAEVSAHYLVAIDGRIYRLVNEAQRAWHAGTAAWGGVTDVNSHSVGIELDNPAALAGFPPFPEPQMTALELLLADVIGRHQIPLARVLGHSDVAPGRKADPGPKFDWCRLAIGGLSIWPDSSELRGMSEDMWPAFRVFAETIGYRRSDAAGWDAVLDAFRLRFRSCARGEPIHPEDVALAAAVAKAHPCIDPDVPTA